MYKIIYNVINKLFDVIDEFKIVKASFLIFFVILLFNMLFNVYKDINKAKHYYKINSNNERAIYFSNIKEIIVSSYKDNFIDYTIQFTSPHDVTIRVNDNTYSPHKEDKQLHLRVILRGRKTSYNK